MIIEISRESKAPQWNCSTHEHHCCISPVQGERLYSTSVREGDSLPAAERQGRAACENADGVAVPCCSIEYAGWVLYYWIFASITAVWVFFVCRQLRTFVIAGSISQW